MTETEYYDCYDMRGRIEPDSNRYTIGKLGYDELLSVSAWVYSTIMKRCAGTLKRLGLDTRYIWSFIKYTAANVKYNPAKTKIASRNYIYRACCQRVYKLIICEQRFYDSSKKQPDIVNFTTLRVNNDEIKHFDVLFERLSDNRVGVLAMSDTIKDSIEFYVRQAGIENPLRIWNDLLRVGFDVTILAKEYGRSYESVHFKWRKLRESITTGLRSDFPELISGEVGNGRYFDRQTSCERHALERYVKLAEMLIKADTPKLLKDHCEELGIKSATRKLIKSLREAGFLVSPCKLKAVDGRLYPAFVWNKERTLDDVKRYFDSNIRI